MTVLEARDVTKVYGSGHTAVRAVDGVSLSLAPGEIVLCMGPSGSGKTTLLTMLGGLLRPTKGQDIAAIAPREQPAWRRREIGFVFQSFNLLSALTAEENVAVPLLAAGWPRTRALARARELLDRLDLGRCRTHLPRDLSGGERQRVAIARALAADPDLILADEPTANLDSRVGHEVTQILCEIACEDQKAVIIVSHDPRLCDVAKRILTMEDGRLLREEPGGHDRTCRMCAHERAG